VVPGNIAHPNLGMSKEEFYHHARSSSVVFHLGAYVNYALPYSAHHDANIVGLLNMLEFVNTGRLKPLNYFSSIGACDASTHLTGTTIPENERARWIPSTLSSTSDIQEVSFLQRALFRILLPTDPP